MDQVAALARLTDLTAGLAPAGTAKAAGATPLSFQRGLPAPALGNPAVTPAAAAGMAATTLGPFVDTVGALRWIDLVPPLTQVAITQAGATAPACRDPRAAAHPERMAGRWSPRSRPP